jgi:hypothetical protein
MAKPPGTKRQQNVRMEARLVATVASQKQTSHSFCGIQSGFDAVLL